MFAIVLLLLALAIAYYHYVQGFFSAALSMVAALFAVCLAFGFMPQVAQYLVDDKMPDSSYGVALAALFSITYIAQRIIVDALVPGNVRVNLYADKAGAAICGLIVGGIAVGVLATVAESLPLAPGILWYARADMTTGRHVVGINNRGAQTDYNMGDEVADGKLPDSPKTMVVPFDDMVVGFAGHASAGSLSGAALFNDMFPDYLTEAFANRLGVQVGANHSAVNNAKGSAVKVIGLYTVAKDQTLKQVDEDLPAYHEGAQPPKTLAPGPGQMIVIVRAVVSNTNAAADTDSLFRFGMSSARLVVGGKDYYPVGTLQGTDTVFFDRIDDPLFLDLTKGPQGVDLVYLIDSAGVTQTPKKTSLQNGSFFVFKRFARIDLSGSAGEIVDQIPSPDDDHVNVLRKPPVLQSLAAPGAAK